MARPAREAGIYVHFPFCLRKCPYCDFASIARPIEAIAQHAYTQAVLQEAVLRAGALRERLPFTSVYLGGGTPSLWQPSEVAELVEGLLRTFEMDRHGVEVTLECNPSSLSEARAREYARSGVTRMSVGVQSTRDAHLVFLGRLHDARSGLDAVRWALGSGVERVSADMIIGLPNQTPEEAAADAVAIASSGVGHVSAYLLTVEAGTPFGEARAAGRLREAEEEAAAEAYLAVSDALTACGFEHYEVSSHAREGQRSVHNMAVWRGGSYVGLGAGAVGLVTDEAGLVRYRNASDPELYVQATTLAQRLGGQDQGGWVESGERLDAETRMAERILSGLRVVEGVDFEELGEELGVPGWTARRRRAAAWLGQRGRVEVAGARVRIPRRQWLWESDTIARLL